MDDIPVASEELVERDRHRHQDGEAGGHVDGVEQYGRVAELDRIEDGVGILLYPEAARHDVDEIDQRRQQHKGQVGPAQLAVRLCGDPPEQVEDRAQIVEDVVGHQQQACEHREMAQHEKHVEAD
jgi:hypothetical protein